MGHSLSLRIWPVDLLLCKDGEEASVATDFLFLTSVCPVQILQDQVHLKALCITILSSLYHLVDLNSLLFRSIQIFLFPSQLRSILTSLIEFIY